MIGYKNIYQTREKKKKTTKQIRLSKEIPMATYSFKLAANSTFGPQIKILD